MTLDVEAYRKQFPALKRNQVYFDNAGGSQTLGSVIQSISDYLSNSNVQMGASYAVGRESTDKYTEGCNAAARYINAEYDEVVLGPSTTQLFRNLSFSLTFSKGNELLLSKLNHEANTAPWVAIAERDGLTVKWWDVEPSSNPQLDPQHLKSFLTPKTKLVAIPHTSNILGTVHDIRAIANVVHETVPGALVCVDGVAFAPHRRVDVRELGVDFYSFSWYKVYGPHIALLYASRAAQSQLRTLGHFFNPSATLENKLGLAAANYELTQAIPQIVQYLGGDDAEAFFDQSAAHEERLSAILLDFLNGRADVRVYGERTPDRHVRVPTISFVVKGWDSRALVERIEGQSNYGFRWGHFYAKRLCDEVLRCGEDGVIRVSMVHYNTENEIGGLVKLLIETLDGKQ